MKQFLTCALGMSVLIAKLAFAVVPDNILPVIPSNNSGIYNFVRSSKDLCPAVAECIKKLDEGKDCDLLPVPERSRIPAIQGNFRLTPLRKGVWAYDDGAYLSLILRQGRSLAFIDFPDSVGSNKEDGSKTRLTDAAELVLKGTVPKMVYFVYSHDHYDHIGGATRVYEYFRKKFPTVTISVWGTSASRRMIKKSKSKRAIVPDKIIGKKGAVLDLGKGLKVEIDVIKGHTLRDLAIFIPRRGDEAGVLMHVDVVFPRWAPFLNLAIAEVIEDFVESHEVLLKYDFDVFVSGHLLLGERKDVEESLAFAKDVLVAGAAGANGITQEDLVAGGIGDFFDPSKVEFGNVWYAFVSVTRKLQIDGCYRIMIEKWGCRLGGLDVVLRSHCFLGVTYAVTDG